MNTRKPDRHHPRSWFMQQAASALLCFSLSTAFILGPSPSNIGGPGLYNSGWAKEGGNGGGNGGGDGGGNSGSGKGKGGESGKGGTGNNGLSGATQAPDVAVAMAQKSLSRAVHAFEIALAQSEIDASKLVGLERAITAAENQLRNASAKAAALD